MTPRLYDYVLSGNCYKVRLLAALLDVDLEIVPVDFHPGNAHRSQEFLDLNPAGTLPVLEHDGLVLTESAAILVYLARTFDKGGSWFPDAPRTAGEVTEWLSFAAALTATSGVARLHDMIGRPADIDAARAGAIRALRLLEQRIAEQRFEGAPWLVGCGPTIADVACFPYTALAPDGGILLDDFPSIALWMRAMRALPGFIVMPGIHSMHDSPDPALPGRSDAPEPQHA